jgi:transposase
MSMKPQVVDSIPEETQRLAHLTCPKGCLVMDLRDALGPIYQDEDFSDLFAKRGRSAIAPWRLALITVLQVIEGLTDQQAIHQMQTRVDWWYALSLSPGDPVFDASILTDFRQRLLDHQAQERLLEPILRISRERGWLKSGGKQRTDSTAVLARVRTLRSLESVGESMRATLNEIARQEPDWLDEHVEPDWFDLYVHRFELARFPKEESKRAMLRQQVGENVQKLLEMLAEASTPASLRDLPEVQQLQQVFAQHYEIQGQQVRWRDGPAVPNGQRIVSPYDPDARSSRKRETTWLGYKVHLTETCDQDRSRPHLITNVETEVATTHDSETMPLIQQHLREHDLAPKEQYVDQGYMSGPQLVEQEAWGTQLKGPVALQGGWQAAEQSGYAAQDFALNWQEKRATCPQGQQSLKWSRRYDQNNQPYEFIRFPGKICSICEVHEQCTKGIQQGRTLSLPIQPVHQALQQRRQEQFTPVFLKSYAVRSGIEGTISQTVRGLGLRTTPYRGRAKTHFHHLAVASGLNLLRIAAFLRAQSLDRPIRRSRGQTPFAQAQERWKASCA